MIMMMIRMILLVSMLQLCIGTVGVTEWIECSPFSHLF